MAGETIPILTRAQLSQVFKDPRILLAFETLQRQVALGIPEEVNQAIDTADNAQIAADNAQFDASNALALGAALQNPSYVTLAPSTTLNNERVLQGATGVTLPVVGGTVTITVDVLAILGYTPVNPANPVNLASTLDVDGVATLTGGATLGGVLGAWSRTVAELATLTPAAGSVAYASNGRKNGEGPGLGTGVLVFRDASNWIACDSGTPVAA